MDLVRFYQFDISNLQVINGAKGRLVHGYLGIPYALAPTGELRFQKPVMHPGNKDGETFAADKMMPACFQVIRDFLNHVCMESFYFHPYFVVPFNHVARPTR